MEAYRKRWMLGTWFYLPERQRCGPRGSVERNGTLLSVRPLSNATAERQWGISCAEHPANRRCHCRNTHSHGNAEDATAASSMDVGNLPTRTRRARVWGCMLGWKNASLCREKACRCCHCACRAELTVSSGTARPSVQNDGNCPVVATFPCGRPPAISKQERCPPP